MPLSKWMDLTVDGNLHSLIKQGNPPQHILAEVEQNLRIQYADAIGDGEYKLYCSLVREITGLEITLTQIHSLVATLRNVYTPVLAKCLNKAVHTDLKLDVNDPEQYDSGLDRAINRSKAIKINIDLKRIALSKIEKKYEGKEGKATREYFYGVLITLSNEAGYQVSENITVWEFCERIKRVNKNIEHKNTVKNG